VRPLARSAKLTANENQIENQSDCQTGIVREKLNDGSTYSFKPEGWLTCFHQP